MVDETRGSGTAGSPEEDRAPDDDTALMPVEAESPEAPPLDVDQRTDEATSDEPIAMPEQTQPRGSRWNDKIDELVPLPQDEPYHDSDDAAPDPYDALDQVDLHVPTPTGDASEEVDDFSTGEEIDVDNAPAGHNPDHARESADPVDDSNVDDTQAFTTTAAAAPAGTTTCPTCGNETDALRFCGYCGEPLTESRREITGETPVERLTSRAAGFLEPLASWTRPGGVRAILALGGVLVLISLLANSGGMALVIGSAILPAIVLYWCRQSDVFENEPWYIVAGFAIAGVVTGALLGWLGAFTAERSWFDEGVLNFGAAGFGGRFAEAAGTAPFIVWLVCGVLIPVAALAAIIAGPMLMRQTASLRNEVMDGLTLAAAIGGGYAVGSALVFVSPMFGQPGPSITASAWTLTTIGITVLRPLVWTLAGGMLGAAAWRYLLSGKLSSALIPAAAGIAIPLLMTMLSIQVSTTGLWAEVGIGVVVAVAAAMLYQRTMADAIREDRRVLGNDNSRLVCPNCHRVTPAGQFCAHCGEALAVPAQA